MKSRILKVYRKVRYRALDHTTIPEIRLEGKWLSKSGFKEGKTIKVEVRKEKLIITIIEVK